MPRVDFDSLPGPGIPLVKLNVDGGGKVGRYDYLTKSCPRKDRLGNSAVTGPQRAVGDNLLILHCIRRQGHGKRLDLAITSKCDFLFSFFGEGNQGVGEWVALESAQHSTNWTNFKTSRW